jgi:hypothetical protein
MCYRTKWLSSAPKITFLYASLSDRMFYTNFCPTTLCSDSTKCYTHSRQSMSRRSVESYHTYQNWAFHQASTPLTYGYFGRLCSFSCSLGGWLAVLSRPFGQSLFNLWCFDSRASICKWWFRSTIGPGGVRMGTQFWCWREVGFWNGTNSRLPTHTVSRRRSWIIVVTSFHHSPCRIHWKIWGVLDRRHCDR